ncbi:MAG TPA: MarR family transcriptional regulator [Xanthobacteraceae bacterium]|nr:MarR family transcriptional regulator [Xanthobacteraceae bacterium]
MPPREIEPTDVEALVRDEPKGSKHQLRLWLRLLSCTNLITAEIRQRLRGEFEFTLPRFDLMAQLDREPNGLRLSELSKRMMVTNGNLTGLVERLIEEGYVRRVDDPSDGRASVIRLTKVGGEIFKKLATAHEAWLASLFDGLSAEAAERLMKDLGALKRSVVEVGIAYDCSE